MHGLAFEGSQGAKKICQSIADPVDSTVTYVNDYAMLTPSARGTSSPLQVWVARRTQLK